MGHAHVAAVFLDEDGTVRSSLSRYEQAQVRNHGVCAKKDGRNHPQVGKDPTSDLWFVDLTARGLYWLLKMENGWVDHPSDFPNMELYRHVDEYTNRGESGPTLVIQTDDGHYLLMLVVIEDIEWQED